jgi:hypothetical protein
LRGFYRNSLTSARCPLASIHDGQQQQQGAPEGAKAAGIERRRVIAARGQCLPIARLCTK